MKGLLLKDFYNCKELRKSFLLLQVFSISFSVLMKSNIYPLVVSVVFGMTMILSLLTAEEKGGAAGLLVLPVSRRLLVLEKYLASLLFQSFSLLCAAAVGGAVTIGFRMDQREFLATFYATAVTCMYLLSFMIPLALWCGVEKARWLGILIYVPVPLLILGKERWSGRLAGGTLYTAVTALTVLLLLSSYLVSCRIFQKKEIS